MGPSELLSLYRYATDDVTHFALAMNDAWMEYFFRNSRPTQIDTRSISPIVVRLLKPRCRNIAIKYRGYCREIFNSTCESLTTQRDALRRYYRGNAISSKLVRKNRYETTSCGNVARRVRCDRSLSHYRNNGSEKKGLRFSAKGKEGARSLERGARSMYALSLHTVYCNIYVRHCNKNANSFVIKCFSSLAHLP